MVKARAAVAWEARVNELVGSDADIAAYVRQLEERDDDQIDESDLPSGDTCILSVRGIPRKRRCPRTPRTCGTPRAMSTTRGHGSPCTAADAGAS